MGSKRELDSSYDVDDGEAAPQPAKRQKSQQFSRGRQQQQQQQQQPATDPTYGQRSMFPGLDDHSAPGDNDLEYEDEQDALAYLRSVREQANNIPHLLVAPKAGPQLPSGYGNYDDDDEEDGIVDRSIYVNGMGDTRGYYQDGAYTAAPDSDPSESDEDAIPPVRGRFSNNDDVDDDDEATLAEQQQRQKKRLAEAYHASLVARFTALRRALRRPPPPSAVAALPSGHATAVPAFGPRSPAFRAWGARLRHTDPLPAQVAAMDRASAVRLLRVLLGGNFVRRGRELRERTSRWLWAVLARLPDRGELDHVEVGWVRDLGKRAVLMMVSIAEMAALRDQVEGGVDGDEEEGERGGSGDDDDDDDELELDAEEEGILAELYADDDGGEETGQRRPPDLPAAEEAAKDIPAAVEQPPAKAAVVEDPAASDDGEADMDLDMEEGEVSDDEPAPTSVDDVQADIAAAKARLLARLEEDPEEPSPAEHGGSSTSPSSRTAKKANRVVDKEEVFDAARSRINMRATLNMILTVAGEFYGQRDLLEFRDPFTGL